MPQTGITEPPIFIQTLRNKQAISGGHQTVGPSLGHWLAANYYTGHRDNRIKLRIV